MELKGQNKNELDIRRNEDLIQAFANADNVLNKNYLRVLNQLEVEDLPIELSNINIISKVRFMRINKLVYNKNEDGLDKLSTVLNSASLSRASIATIIYSDGKKIDYYIGVINKDEENDLTLQAEILNGTFKANFAGSELDNLTNRKLENLFDDIFDVEGESKIITSVSGVAALKLNDNKEAENYIQGLEKFVDSIKDKNYTAILLADPVASEQVQIMRSGYESLYSQLTPFLKSELSFNESDALTLTDGNTTGMTQTVNTSISHTQNHSESNGWSKSDSVGNSKTKNAGGALAAGGAAIGAVTGTILGPVGTMAGVMIGGAIGGAVGAIGSAIVGSNTASSNTTTGETQNTSDSTGESTQEGNSNSTSNQNSISTSEGNTRGRTIQISYENRSVKGLLEKIDEQLERIKRCEDFGTFSFAAYFISNDAAVNERAASSYNALMRGENSSVESSFINTWYEGRSNKKVCKYLQKLSHPIFKLNLSDDEHIKISPASIISGKELAIQLSLPKKSIVGLPVVQCTEFGRNIFTLSNRKSDDSFKLGNIYHMGQSEATSVDLDKQSLAMHTFITGSTGSGKSNTIYNMLESLNNKDVKFLVVEPAKGEYKNVLGHRKDVTVLGTNPYKTKLLKINPFKFSKEIHVLEHIDRLIEIFNVCWPMYAAMPAVLKDAVERAYEDSGWDLDLSENKYNENLFPTFADVLIKLTQVVNESAFSDEVKGNYVGSLVTRVKSLTNGINGRIFASDEIDNNILFDSNVIVDLSRVGSVETKSMIMGILIMRLQEHRMSQGGMNLPLKHITVLEEAHNILKKTSIEQSAEGSNMVGKSVEMISNLIAEIRTYGEGFIIADQSPGLLDMSAIRNTNTKIILRLPEQSDRELVGRAAGLNDDQLVELAKLETGVAAVYQNNWLEPVLCKVDRFESKEKEFIEREESSEFNKSFKKELSKILLSNHVGEKIDYDIDELEERLLKSNFTSNLKISVINILKTKDLSELKHVSRIISMLYSKEEAYKLAKNTENIDEWNQIVLDNIDPIVYEINENYRNGILQCLVRENAKDHKELENFYFNWSNYMRGKVL
ncbi:ATP-binding protein [Clostridium vincentii]|uniref:AAA-like domain protein n=1 Tax=Clostridium vincentii TaxID=52704 RepID=A0A2T0BDM6_9CLOT|nr:ATP-binding protein [Clostridium vincentii]PRR82001.1 AAA-like domain protein [Clostridium vincentii]